MGKLLLFTVTFVVLGLMATGEAAAQAKNNALGTIDSIDVPKKTFLLVTDNARVTVTVSDATKFFRKPKGERDLKNAEAITLNDLRVGQRAIAIGQLSDDGTLLMAPRAVVVDKE